ncbi:MAG TPA: RDD family protein, partial [Longimicrobium sp.]
MSQAAAAYALNDRQVDVETPEHVSVGYELADMGSRFTAMLIDGLVIVLLLFIVFVGLIAVGIIGAVGLGSASGLKVAVAIMVLMMFLVFWGYFVYYEGFRDG